MTEPSSHSRRTRIAVVTGASAGIGRATAVAFAEAGFDVALLARGRAGLDAAAAEVRAKGRRALAISTDVADEEQVFAAAQQVEDELGEIDVWVNDAMTTAFAPTWDIAPDDFRRAVDVTFLGQVWGTLAALKYMRARDRGTIINIGSALAFIGIPLQSAYCASKFACRGFVESIRAELLHEGSHVRMGMVHMPAVNTPQFTWCLTTMHRHPQPVPPIYEPEKVAQYVVRSAVEGRRSKIVGSWNHLVVAAGQFTPGFGNHYAALGAWESQLTGQPIRAGRPVNLHEPADEDTDAGARGIFSHKAGGFLDPSFLRSLPTTAVTFARAAGAYGQEKVALWRRSEQPARLARSMAATASAVRGAGSRSR